MNYIRHLSGFFIRLAEDQRLTPYHISLYFALFQQWNAERFVDQFAISRSEMMQLSRIGSVNTYARCMKELEQWGYIKYAPSSNLYSGSRVACIRFDTATNTARDTSISSGIENDTGRNTARVTSTSCSIESDTGRNTARDTGSSSGIESDTARSTGCDTGDVTGITGGIKSDTACDTLLINIINKNKLKEERGGIFNFSNEKRKPENKPQKEKSENLPEENFPVPDFKEVEIFFQKNNCTISESQKFFNHYQSNGWKLGGKMRIADWQAVARKWMINAKNFENNERESNQIRIGKLSVSTNKDYSEPL